MESMYHSCMVKTFAKVVLFTEQTREHEVKIYICTHFFLFTFKNETNCLQVQRLLAVIRGLSKSVPSQKLIVGNVASGWVPVRNPKSKYFITEDQYAEASYPAFVTGPSYLVSKLAVKILYYSALEHPFLHLEDVFLTGIIAEKEDIPRRHAVEFRNNPVRIPAKFLGCTLLRTISIHKVLPKEQKELAEMATNPQCGKGLHKLH